LVNIDISTSLIFTR